MQGFMGNRNHCESLKPRINPVEYPRLHVVPSAEKEGALEYVPNLVGMQVGLGKAILDRTSVVDYALTEVFEIPLLPEIVQIPPPEINTVEQVYEVVQKHIGHIVDRLDPVQHNIISCWHGTYFGLAPELAIADNLQAIGFDVSPTFPKIGGRNRIQEHAILISGYPK